MEREFTPEQLRKYMLTVLVQGKAPSGDIVDNLLLETTDNLLLETDDLLVME